MKEYKATVKEVRVETNGYGLLCVFGRHVNGGWCAILTDGFNVACELADTSVLEIHNNASRIAEALGGIVDRYELNDDVIYDIALDISQVITPMIVSMG